MDGEEVVAPLVILKARIALLATAIGGPDYTSSIVPPPYKLGDDCLACLKDLKRWFKLVDDQQNRLDVAMAAAEYKILVDDLVPILIDWETKCAALKKQDKDGSDEQTYSGFANKTYYDKVALHSLQIMVLMTWPLILTDQSTISQVNNYTELKKHQLIYKKAILSTQNGKVLKAIVRLVTDVIRTNRLDRTPRDNIIIKLALNFFRNLISIEPGELTISTKKQIPKGINSVDTLPPTVSMDDISLNTVVNSFQRNKVLSLLLTLCSSLSTEFDQDFINIPLLEIMFFITKDINQDALFQATSSSNTQQGNNDKNIKQVYASKPNLELSQLLAKETQMKKNLIKHTSSRHSRFGAMLSIEAPDHGRLTVSGAQNILNDSSSLDKIDARKKWNKRTTRVKDDPLEEGLPNSLLNSQNSILPLLDSTTKSFTKFLNNFIDSGFNILLHSITNHLTTEQDRLTTIEQIEYLLFYSWFVKYQTLRCKYDTKAEIILVSDALNETSFILICHFLRSSYDMKNWIVVHASMIAFNELLILLDNKEIKSNEEFDSNYIISRLFSDDRIQLLSNLPKTAFKHSQQYMKTIIDLTHTCLKVLEVSSEDNQTLIVNGKARKHGKKNTPTEEDIQQIMDEDNVDRDTAIDILTPAFKQIDVNFTRVQNSYINDPTMDTYIRFLQRYNELDHSSIKKVITFFQRVFVRAKEETFLFRIDLIILLRDMLSDNGLIRNSKTRKYVEEFSNYFLYRLKKRLKVSPAWYVGLLFPSLHDSQVGFFQRYGEKKMQQQQSLFGVPITRFRSIEDENMLSPSVVRNMKIAILVSTLIDDGKMDILENLVENLDFGIVKYKENNSSELLIDIKLILPDENKDALIIDKDFRALLDFLGYHISEVRDDDCYLPKTVNYEQVIQDFSSIKIYLNTPFETPNGKPSSSYLIRPLTNGRTEGKEADGWGGYEDYDYDDPSIVRDDDEYFKTLDSNMEERLKDKQISRGLAKSKSTSKHISKKPSKKRTRNNLPMFDVDEDDESNKHISKSSHAVASKEYISDSDDSDDTMNPIFFQNEMYMRWLLDKHDGQLSEENYSLFGKFSSERMNNNGSIISDFTSLFGGPTPNIGDLNTPDFNTNGPNKSLLDLSSKKMSDTFDTQGLFDEEYTVTTDVVNKSTDDHSKVDNNNETQIIETTAETNLNYMSTESENLKNLPSESEEEIEFNINENELSDDEYDGDEPATQNLQRKKARILAEEDDE